MTDFTVEVASEKHLKYVPEILKTIEDAARDRGTGIAKRKPEYVESKIKEGKAIIAMHGDEFVGFCYIECWGHGQFVANSGLIVIGQLRKSDGDVTQPGVDLHDGEASGQAEYLCVREFDPG